MSNKQLKRSLAAVWMFGLFDAPDLSEVDGTKDIAINERNTFLRFSFPDY